MRRLPIFLIAMLAPAGGALAMPGGFPAAGSVTPDRVVKFLDMSFSDSSSWSCSGPQEGQQATTNGCTTCMNHGSSASDVTVARAPDATEERISVPNGAGVEICGDVIALHGAPSSSTSNVGASVSRGGTTSSGTASSGAASPDNGGTLNGTVGGDTFGSDSGGLQSDAGDPSLGAER